MKPLRLATVALLWGALTACVTYGQPPGYGSPQSPPQYQDNRGYGDYGGYNNSPRVDIGFFYDELSPYGDWVMTVDHGWAWFPRDVNPYWRPYNEGRWVNSEYGWTWVSYEPFGWATYHYGRWTLDPRYGWLWVPGTIWGPAWVSWQSGGGYIGWAPLPPQIGFEIGVGIRLGGFNLSVGIRPDWYNFVPERSFLDPRLSGYRLPTARNITIINNTKNITNYTYIDNRVINRGVEVRQIELVTGQRVQSYRVAESKSQQRSEVAKDEVRIYRPEKQKLETVRAAPRLNAGQRPEPAPKAEREPAAKRPDAPDVEVAPRVRPTPKTEVRRIDQQAARERQELSRHQTEEKQKIEKLHGQELARAKAQSEREQVEKRNQAEREALLQEQREAAQQLEARQKAKRQAVVVTPPAEKSTSAAGKKATDPKQDKKKKAAQEEKDKQQGKDKKPEPPPPAV